MRMGQLEVAPPNSSGLLPPSAKRLGPLTPDTAVWWTLRIGAFLCFVGHGAFGVITKEAWVPFFGVAGIGRDSAYQLMPVVGIVDILLGIAALVQPRPVLIAYMSLWAIWTAALRPLTGQPIWEMLERAGNYGVPIALLILSQVSRDWRSWVAPAAIKPLTPRVIGQLRITLAVTTALLLIGHGALGVQQKPELVAHYAFLAPLMSGASLAPILGWTEIALAALVLWRQSVGLGIFLFGWKLVTEMLFLVAGAPAWEVVERGGSYAAPLALALLLVYERQAALTNLSAH